MYARRKPTRVVGLLHPWQPQGHMRFWAAGGGRAALTGGSLGVVAHEALPRSCRFTEAKHVEEPRFFQMELNLVQILFQEHKAQRTGVCLPATQHSEAGQRGCGHGTARLRIRASDKGGAWSKPLMAHLRKEQPVKTLPREFLLLNTEGGQHGPQDCSLRECQVRAWSGPEFSCI